MASIDEIKKIRDMTGAGINVVREALAETDGDTEAALKYLRQKGEAKAEKRKDRTTSNGRLGVYIHTNSRIVTVVEVGVETDFAANSEDIANFANQIAVHVAASNPEFITPDSIDEARLNELKDEFTKDLDGKPEEVKEKIMQGKLDKYYKQSVLLHQNFFSDDEKTVEDVINELVAKVGEKIEIKMFTKFEVAQGINYCSTNKD